MMVLRVLLIVLSSLGPTNALRMGANSLATSNRASSPGIETMRVRRKMGLRRPSRRASIFDGGVQCDQIEKIASQLWAGKDFTELSWRSADLASAIRLALAESELETISEEREKRMTNFTSREEYFEALGIGTPRDFENYSPRDYEEELDLKPVTSTRDLKRAEKKSMSDDIGVSSLRGYHAQNEDFMIWLETFGVTALGLFDGHGGVQHSQLAAHAMLRWLPAQWMQMMKGSRGRSQSFWEQKLSLDFQCVQQLLRGVDDKSGGSTGIVVVADKLDKTSQLGIPAVVAWVGDSQLLHARRNDAGDWVQQHVTSTHDCAADDDWKSMIKQTHDNCPDCKRFEPKICESHDGKASTYYGPLKHKVGVTRAFGDFTLVEHGVMLGAVPSMKKLDLQPGDLLILGSDGLWDALDEDRVMEEVNKAAKSESSQDACQFSTKELSSDLANLAKTSFWDKQGYQDDISVMAWCVPPHADDSSVSSFLGNQDIAQDWLKGGAIGDRCQVIQEKAGMVMTQLSTCGRVSRVDLTNYDANGFRLKCYHPDGSRPGTHEFGFCAIPRKRPCLLDKFVNGGCHEGLVCTQSSQGYFCDYELDNSSDADELAFDIVNPTQPGHFGIYGP